MADNITPSFGTARVTGTFYSPSGERASGQWRIIIPRVVNVTDRTVIRPGVYRAGFLSVTPGTFSIDSLVPATDDMDNASSFYVVVEIIFSDGVVERYRERFPQGTTVDLTLRQPWAGKYMADDEDPVVVGNEVPPATATQIGGIRLAGDLGGTADSPTVPALAGMMPEATFLSLADDLVSSEELAAALAGKVNIEDVNAPFFVSTTADASNSTTTFAAVLTQPVQASTLYHYAFNLLVSGDTTSDMKVRVNGPAGATAACVVTSLNAAATSVAEGQKTEPLVGLATASSACGLLGGATSVIRVEGWIYTGTTAGSLSVDYAQSTSSGSAVTVKSGSWGRISKQIS